MVIRHDGASYSVYFGLACLLIRSRQELGRGTMDEIYAFDATIAERWPNQLQIVPDDFDGLVAFYQRAGITTDPHWHPNHYVTVNKRELIQKAEGATRVRYSLRANGTRTAAVDLVVIDDDSARAK